MQTFYGRPNNLFHRQLLEAMQKQDAISLTWWEQDYYQGSWFGFVAKLDALNALSDSQAQEAILRFVMDVLPNGAYSNPEHEFWGSKDALDVAEIMDNLLDSYAPIGWYFGTFNREGAVDGRSLGWCKCGCFTVKDWNITEISGTHSGGLYFE